MSYNILVTNRFKKDTKQLLKKYKSLKDSISTLIDELLLKPDTGTCIGNDCYKIRIAIKEKNKGKSGGARVITCVKIINETVYLLTIYDKSEKENISDSEILEILKDIE